MIIDQDVRNQVLDVNQSFLVQAPAGSGKTTLLVKRYLCLLSVVEKDPEEIIAITFTRKAAAEMRERVLDALQDNSDPIVRKVLERDEQLGWNILENPARLKVQTIDSLCARIAGNLPVVTRFGAAPQIADNTAVLYERAVDQMLLTETAALNTLLLHLDNDRWRVKTLLVNMLQIREQWLPLIARDDFLDVLSKSLQILHTEILDDLYVLLPSELNCCLFVDQIPESYSGWLHLANILLTSEGKWRKRLTKEQGFFAPSSSKNKQEKIELQTRKNLALAMIEKMHAYDAFRQQLQIIQMLPDDNYSERQWELLSSLTEVLKLLAAQLILVFKEMGQVDHTEVSLAALRGLAQQDQVAQAFDYKLSHILVDEFQDTSITQFTLLEYLVANWGKDDGKTLFLVGDPMQSIYRFRQAEVGLFLKAKQRGIGNIKLNYAQLQVNFRSSNAVVKWINETFKHSFPEHDDMSLGAITYKESTAADSTDKQMAVECINTENEVAKIIEVIKKTPKSNSIAILVRARSHLAEILPALREHEVNYQGTDLESLYERPAVQDLCALTESLLHLDDRIAWLAVLRAPWLGLTLANLLAISEYEGTIWQALQAFSKEEQGSTSLQRFVQVLHNAVRQAGRVPIDQLVKETWQSLGGAQCLRSLGELHDVESYFKFLTSNARKREIYRPGYLQEQLLNISVQPQTFDPHAVQIMTMHKAKGLEFDVVIIPGLSRQTRGNDSKLLLLERRDFNHDYLLVAPIKASNEASNKLYDYLAWCEKQRQEYEALRLLYVAVTRAKCKIYALANIQEGEPSSNCLLSDIWHSVCHQFKLDNTAIEKNKRAIKMRRLPDYWYRDNPYHEPVITKVDKHKQFIVNDWQRLVGTVVHRALWHMATCGLESMPDWQQYAKNCGLSLQYMSYIDNAIANIKVCEYAKWILDNTHLEHYAEWGLSHRYKDDVEQIIIDRAFLDNEGVFWIVDYKVVFSDDDLTTYPYRKQLQHYGQAVQNMRPDADIKMAVYFPLQKKFIVHDSKDLNMEQP